MINSVVSFDWWFENLMLAIRTPFFLRVFEVVTFFGEPTTIIGLSAIVGLILFSSPRRRLLLAGFIVTLGGAALSGFALKDIVMRARPTGLIPFIHDTGFSFPSGHATGSMAFYGFIAFLISRSYPQHTFAVTIIAVFIILGIGFSRLYLGVHFPSDVIAGYALGGLWLLVGMRLVGKPAHR